MLVLTRRTDQTIVIGDPQKPEECIEVTVVSTDGANVRLGIQAPRNVPVHRREIWDQGQKAAAAEAAS